VAITRVNRPLLAIKLKEDPVVHIKCRISKIITNSDSRSQNRTRLVALVNQSLGRESVIKLKTRAICRESNSNNNTLQGAALMIPINSNLIWGSSSRCPGLLVVHHTSMGTLVEETISRNTR
jgi:hypothetical protein